MNHFSDRQPLIDNHQRPINYVRLSVTDRCNLRCVYCMPEKMQFLPRAEILSYEEMERLMALLATMGITKIRITGGEPFVRRGLMPFLNHLTTIEGIQELHITTNGVLTTKFIPELAAMGVAGLNLSLDTLDRRRFQEMTRRDELHKVLACLHAALDHGLRVKVNCVVMQGVNSDDILPMVHLARDYPVAVRFIEEMPFNGGAARAEAIHWTHGRILDEIRRVYPQLQQSAPQPHATATSYRIAGHRGSVGVIAGFTRTFCGTCNRIRITARGMMHTCLYGKAVLDLKALLRDGASDAQIAVAIRRHVGQRYKDGWEAQKASDNPVAASMSTIGG